MILDDSPPAYTDTFVSAIDKSEDLVQPPTYSRAREMSESDESFYPSELFKDFELCDKEMSEGIDDQRINELMN